MTRVPDGVLTILASNPAIARVLGASRRRVLTTLFLALPVTALDLVGWYRREVVSGRFSPDPALVFSLYRSLDRKGRVDLATSFCGSSLDTQHFVKLISMVYRTCSPNGREKDHLAETISRHASVHQNISNPAFEKIVGGLLRSRRTADRAQGVLCVSSLSGNHPDHWTRVTQLVQDHSFYVRANAWSAANALAYHRRLSADDQQALVDASLAAIKDKDRTVRHNARLFRRLYSRQ